MDARLERTPVGRPTAATTTRRAAIGLLGLGALSAVCALSGCGCSADTSGPVIEVDPIPVWTSPYDWNAVMENAQGHKFYYPDQRLSSKFGIDVSDHDGDIDWAAAAGDGVEFAFIRAGYRGYTEGGLFEDGYFSANLDSAHANGVPCGVYMFSSAVDKLEAVEEAEFVISRLGGRTLEYPIVFDQEKSGTSNGRADNLGKDQYTANARAFCDRVASAGYSPMVYGNKHQLALLDLDQLEDVPVWYAEFDVPVPTGQYDFAIWQYTASGSVAGISNAAVDFNIQFLVEDE